MPKTLTEAGGQPPMRIIYQPVELTPDELRLPREEFVALLAEREADTVFDFGRLWDEEIVPWAIGVYAEANRAG
jgi:hypothetical protein